ncbi:MAG: helix-turn-helix domain-containing protein [Acidimicrobiia bacterium]
MSGGRFIREARRRAGLTQAQLAKRLRTTQSVIARWETGRRSPDFATVVRAVRACGLEMHISLTRADPDHDSLIDDQLARAPADRLEDLLDRLRTEDLLHRGKRVG